MTKLSDVNINQKFIFRGRTYIKIKETASNPEYSLAIDIRDNKEYQIRPNSGVLLK